MTFDEELERAFATLTDRVRDEISRQIQQVAAGLAAAAREDRDRACADLRREAERDAEARVTVAAAQADARRHDEERRAREEGRAVGLEEGRAESAESYEQGKAAGTAQGRDEGRRAEREAADARTRANELAASERLADGVRALDRARSLSEILDTLASCAGREGGRVGVFLATGGRFRGWRFIGFDRAFDAANQIDITPDEAGVVAEAMRNAMASGDTNQAPAFAALPAGRASVALPIAMSGQVVAVLYADQGVAPEPAALWPDRLDVLARHGARCLEAVVALKATRVLSERPDLAAVPAVAGGDHTDETAAAQRYAKLLVSEIRLYHEPEVAAGRRDGDLGTRLGGEIARARALYNERVPDHVRTRGDYFQEELVRTLAHGDSRLLNQRT